MSLILTEEETMLADAARKFLGDEAPVTAFRALRDSGDSRRINPALWQGMAAMGLAAPQLSEADGGAGMGVIAAGIVAKEIGRTVAATPFLSSVLAAEVISLSGSAELKAELLPGILDASRIIGFALEESARHNPKLCATKVTNGRISGLKRGVADAVNASQFIVVAVENGRHGLWLVEAGAPGLSLHALDGIDHHGTADLRLDDVAGRRIPADTEAVIARVLDIGRVLLAAESLGMAQEAFDRTIAYLKEREQFGRRIGSFQALQHRAARCYIALEQARAVVMKALRTLDHPGADSTAIASAAKYFASTTAFSVIGEAVQMHGGIGVTDELDIGFFVKRSYAAGLQFGDARFQKDNFGASLSQAAAQKSAPAPHRAKEDA